MPNKTNHSICAVAICNSPKTDGTIYHRFPSDPVLREQWLKATMRKDKVNPSTASICSNHFVDDDYVPDRMHELLGIPRRRRLKQGSVPTQNLGLKLVAKQRMSEVKSLEQTRQQVQKQMIQKLLYQDVEPVSFSDVIANHATKTGKPRKGYPRLPVDPLVVESAPKPKVIRLETPSSNPAATTTIAAADRHLKVVTSSNLGPLAGPINSATLAVGSTPSSRDAAVQVDVRNSNAFEALVAENQLLAKKLELQTETNKFLRRRLVAHETKQKPKKMAVAGDETPLKVVSPEQLESSKKRVRNVWSEEEIASYLILKNSSEAIYDFIKKNMLLPIPSQSTLAKFAHLKYKYRVSQNGFVEKIPLPELVEVGPALQPAATQACHPTANGSTNNLQNAPLVHLKFVSNESPEEVDLVTEDPISGSNPS